MDEAAQIVRAELMHQEEITDTFSHAEIVELTDRIVHALDAQEPKKLDTDELVRAAWKEHNENGPLFDTEDEDADDMPKGEPQPVPVSGVNTPSWISGYNKGREDEAADRPSAVTGRPWVSPVGYAAKNPNLPMIGIISSGHSNSLGNHTQQLPPPPSPLLARERIEAIAQDVLKSFFDTVAEGETANREDIEAIEAHTRAFVDRVTNPHNHTFVHSSPADPAHTTSFIKRRTEGLTKDEAMAAFASGVEAVGGAVVTPEHPSYILTVDGDAAIIGDTSYVRGAMSGDRTFIHRDGREWYLAIRSEDKKSFNIGGHWYHRERAVADSMVMDDPHFAQHVQEKFRRNEPLTDAEAWRQETLHMQAQINGTLFRFGVQTHKDGKAIYGPSEALNALVDKVRKDAQLEVKISDDGNVINYSGKNYLLQHEWNVVNDAIHKLRNLLNAPKGVDLDALVDEIADAYRSAADDKKHAASRLALLDDIRSVLRGYFPEKVYDAQTTKGLAVNLVQHVRQVESDLAEAESQLPDEDEMEDPDEEVTRSEADRDHWKDRALRAETKAKELSDQCENFNTNLAALRKLYNEMDENQTALHNQATDARRESRDLEAQLNEAREQSVGRLEIIEKLAKAIAERDTERREMVANAKGARKVHDHLGKVRDLLTAHFGTEATQGVPTMQLMHDLVGKTEALLAEVGNLRERTADAPKTYSVDIPKPSKSLVDIARDIAGQPSHADLEAQLESAQVKLDEWMDAVGDGFELGEEARMVQTPSQTMNRITSLRAQNKQLAEETDVWRNAVKDAFGLTLHIRAADVAELLNRKAAEIKSLGTELDVWRTGVQNVYRAMHHKGYQAIPFDHDRDVPDAGVRRSVVSFDDLYAAFTGLRDDHVGNEGDKDK